MTGAAAAKYPMAKGGVRSKPFGQVGESELSGIDGDGDGSFIETQV
jgi:hypothetical protein